MSERAHAHTSYADISQPVKCPMLAHGSLTPMIRLRFSSPLAIEARINQIYRCRYLVRVIDRSFESVKPVAIHGKRVQIFLQGAGEPTLPHATHDESKR